MKTVMKSIDKVLLKTKNNEKLNQFLIGSFNSNKDTKIAKIKVVLIGLEYWCDMIITLSFGWQLVAQNVCSASATVHWRCDHDRFNLRKNSVQRRGCHQYFR